MNESELYTTVDSLQKRDAQEALVAVKDCLPWNVGEHILDVGCGPGELTTSLLAPYLPPQATVVGCDILDSMVKYAEAKFGNDQYSFKQLDISSGSIWMNWEEETFDKIFSFYCLHWVEDQIQAAENMYSLLRPNGYIITMLTTSHPFLLLFNVLQTNPKWQPYAKIWKTWDVFYPKGKDPKDEYIKILKDTGFQIVECRTVERSFVHSSLKAFLDYFETINPFKKRIAKERSQEFLEDCQKYLIELGLLEVNQNEEAIHKYTVMTTIAKKCSIVQSPAISPTSSIYQINF